MGGTKFVQPIAGFEYEGKLIILGEIDTGVGSLEPKCFLLNNKF